MSMEKGPKPETAHISSELKAQWYIEMLLMDPKLITDETLGALETAGVILGNDGFMVAITVPDSEDVSLYGVRQEALAFISRWFFGKCTFYSFCINGRIVTIFCLFRMRRQPGEVADRAAWLRSEFADFAAGAKNELGLSLRCAVSKVYFGIESLPAAYRNAQDAAGCFDFLQTVPDRVLPVRHESPDAEASARDYAYFKGVVKRFRRDLSEGNQARCLRHMAEAFDRCLRAPPIAMSAIHLRFNALMELLIAALIYEDGLNAEQLYGNRALMSVISYQGEAALWKAVEGFVEQVFLLKRRATMPWSERANQIRNFMDQNLTDPGLSLSKISDAFWIHPATLSNHFKAQFGTGPWQYIQRRRVELAKDMLKNTSDSLYRIALETGFGSMASMHRAFKRYENATPGRFRGGVKGP